MNAAPTIYSIASDLGVNASTVSRAFSRPELITPQIRERVLARAAEVGYQPNHAARSLVTGRTATIGLVLPDIENPFFPPLVRATQAAAAADHRRVILVDTELRAEQELELLSGISQHVDGLLIASPLNPPARLRTVIGRTPVVLINRRSTGFTSVIIDNSDALRQAADLLADRGHRRIAFIGGPDGSWTAEQRRKAIRAWHRDDCEVLWTGSFDASYEGGLQATRSLAGTKATAAIAFDDLTACGVIAGLAEMGVCVPDDFSVIGCDDVLISRVLTPPLTTITAPIRDLGIQAVDLLAELITEPQHPSRVRKLRGVLADRGTTDAPPGRVAAFLS